MKANSISICIPSLNGNFFYCNKNCPYCISKMTGTGKGEAIGERYFRNLKKAKTMAIACEASSVILTGKTEPTLNLEVVKKVCKIFEDFPIEIQTNGILLNEKNINLLDDWGVDTIAISVDSYEQLTSLSEALKLMRNLSFNIRLTVNLTNSILNDDILYDFRNFLNLAILNDINQLSFRKVVIPDHAINTKESIKVQKWINENVDEEKANKFIDNFTNYILNSGEAQFLYRLPFGADMYMVDGVSCTVFRKCIQEDHKDDDIRSLVYYEDGHLSSTWYGSNYGRLF